MTRSPSPSGRRATTAPRCVRRTANTPTTTKAITMTANSATDIDGSYDAARAFERLHRGATAVGACLYEWARGYTADWWPGLSGFGGGFRLRDVVFQLLRLDPERCDEHAG